MEEIKMDENLEVNEVIEPTEETKEVVEVPEVAAEEGILEDRKYTDKDVDDIVARKIARERTKAEKEAQQIKAQLNKTEQLLKAFTGTESLTDAEETLRNQYAEQGMEMPKFDETYLDERRINTIAEAEAKQVIEAGYEDVVEEVERLARIGVENMNPVDKAMFMQLAKARKDIESKKELEKLGLTEDIFNDQEFNEFRKKINESVPINEVYEMYNKLKPKEVKKIKPLGSMTTPAETKPKDFYTYEESLKFSKEEIDNNPELFETLKRSMARW